MLSGEKVSRKNHFFNLGGVFMRKRQVGWGVLALVLMAMLVFFGCGTQGRVRLNMQAGTYRATVMGFHAPLTVEVTVSTDRINSVRVLEHMETPGFGEWPAELIPARIVENQSLAVDIVSGVTVTSFAIIAAAEAALTQAGADIAALRRPLRAARVRDQTLTADVIVVGGGGAGFAAAITAVEAGASVILIEKAGFFGGNTVAAGGIFNAANPATQSYLFAERSESMEAIIIAALNETPDSEEHRAMIEIVRQEYEAYLLTNRTLFDSPNWHALQTWNAGDRVANLPLVRLFTRYALDALHWLDGLGAGFIPDFVYLGAGSLWPRTHDVYARNGAPYMRALIGAVAGNPRFTGMLDTAATGLIMSGDRVVGVNAVGKAGNRITLRANSGVVLATGGFAGNVALRQEFCEGDMWPNLGPHVPTTNVIHVTGDGIFFARDAGADLVDMEHIQLLHAGNPRTGGTYDVFNVSLTSIFVNREGNRFVAEDGRRDVISNAIWDQTDRIMYIIFGSEFLTNGDPSQSFVNGGLSIEFMVENQRAGFVSAPTIEELAVLLNVPPAALRRTVDEFNRYAVPRDQADPFGRGAFLHPILQGPFFAYPRVPATHHTMGGVRIDEYARALRADGTPVPGLYAAGEITGGIHGSNRLGGNALVDIIVFGRIAGISAAAGR